MTCLPIVNKPRIFVNKLLLAAILTAGIAAVVGRVPSRGAVPVIPTIGLAWNPGGYTDFVVVTSLDLRIPLSQWPAILETGQTNVRVPMTNQAQFYAVYGTDAWSCYSDWATK